MAQNVAVVQSTLPSTLSGTVDLTSSGFGDVDAAIIISGNANTTNNPQDDGMMMVGFWDGTNQRGAGIWQEDNIGDADTTRASSDSEILLFVASPAAKSAWTASAITDGIRLTLTTDNTTVDRYVVAILINGVGVDLRTFTPNSTQNGTASVSGLSFVPSATFFLSIGSTVATDNISHSVFSFGVAVNDGSLTQRMIAQSSEDGTINVDNTLLYSENRIAGQIFNNATTWTAELTSFATDGWTLTTRDGGTGSDVLFALTLGGDALVELFTATTPATATTVDTTTQNDPIALLGFMSTATGTTRHDSGEATEGLCFGIADSLNDYAINTASGDGETVSNERSLVSLSKFIDLDSANATTFNNLADATASLGSKKFTLSYSAVPGAARKGFIVAFTQASNTGNISEGIDLGDTVESIATLRVQVR